MSGPNNPDWSDPTQAGYPPITDPAYSGQYWGPQGQTYYGTPAGPPTGAPMTGPTQQLPPYWQTAGYPGNQPPPPPPPPKSPRWLWIAAGAAVLLVSGLVLALVIVSGRARQSTVVAPLPTTTLPSAPRITTVPTVPTVPRVPTPTTTRSPLPTATLPTTPSTPALPGETTVAPTGTESVVYNVTGEGRAINITYVDTGGVMQTEFNVALPWSKEVSLGAPAKSSASVAVVNVGRDVTCSVSVNGAQVRQRTGRGLTICTGVA